MLNNLNLSEQLSLIKSESGLSNQSNYFGHQNI
jgi:hypothetical protein